VKAAPRLKLILMEASKLEILHNIHSLLLRIHNGEVDPEEEPYLNENIVILANSLREVPPAERTPFCPIKESSEEEENGRAFYNLLLRFIYQEISDRRDGISRAR